MDRNSSSLDKTQYTEQAIRHYEAVYGADFVSPGGAKYALELCRSLNIKSEQRLLDAGCGLGGAAFLMAENFDCYVDAIDVSTNMLRMARDRLAQRDVAARISLRELDCCNIDVSDHYDAIYSRDVFLHIADKSELFRTLYRALKKGGTLLFTDYGCSAGEWSDAFQQYVRQRRYTLHTINEYRDILEQADFTIVQAVDQTDLFVQFLETEYAAISKTDLTPTEQRVLQASWQQKIERAKINEHRWYLFRVIKDKP